MTSFPRSCAAPKISDVQLTKCACVFVRGQVCATACQCQRSSLSERKRRRTAADEETMATGKRSKREKGRTAGRPSQVNTHGNSEIHIWHHICTRT